MKKLLIGTLILNSSFLTFCSAQTWKWGEQATNTSGGGLYGSFLAADTYGNAYLTNGYSFSITFGSYVLNSPIGNMYLVKYDSSGKVQWAEQATEKTSNDVCSGLAVATDTGNNIVVAGAFEDTIQLGSYVLKSKYRSVSDFFLAKYNSNGIVMWAAQGLLQSAASGCNVQAMTTDAAGNIYVTGFFEDTVYFGAHMLYDKNKNRVLFLVKYNPSGLLLWARQANKQGSYGYVDTGGIVADKYGNVIIAGAEGDTASFGSDTLREIGQYMFCVKYDSNGNVLWAEHSINQTVYSILLGQGLTTDNEGNIYVSCNLTDSAYVGPYFIKTKDRYHTEVALVKYSPNGTPLWVEQSIGAINYNATLSSDANNHIYILFNMDTSLCTFAGKTFYNNRYYSYSNSKCLVELDTSGNVICSSVYDSHDYYGDNVASDPSGKYVYISGLLDYDTLAFGNDTVTATGGQSPPFVARWQDCTLNGTNEVNRVESNTTLFPNPNNGRFTIEVTNSYQPLANSSIEIYNMLGEKVYLQLMPQTPKGALITIDLGTKSPGVYMYRLISETGEQIANGKFIIE